MTTAATITSTKITLIEYSKTARGVPLVKFRTTEPKWLTFILDGTDTSWLIRFIRAHLNLADNTTIANAITSMLGVTVFIEEKTTGERYERYILLPPAWRRLKTI